MTLTCVSPALRQTFLALVPILLGSGHATAEPQGLPFALSSGEQRVALVELYTSEGCSSCPPADRWLSGLRQDPGLWKAFVPVALHVDYWDYIGWRDRFARPEYSARQRQYAAEGGAGVVYTPGVFRQGKDWRGWRSASPAMPGAPRVGTLRVAIDNGVATIAFADVNPATRQLTAHVALLGMNLETAVGAGENRGRTLHHDFVALDVVAVPLVKSASAYTATVRLPEAEAGAGELALAAWVSAAGAQAPIQAVGGLLNRR